MLFHDPSCRAETTLRETHALGVYQVCHLDWVAICTKTDRGGLYIDAKTNLTGVDESPIARFWDLHGAELSCDDVAQHFIVDSYHFWKLLVRQDTHYSVLSIYCRKGRSISHDNLKWLHIHNDMKYAYTLLNNESIQEQDLLENIMNSIDSAIAVIDLTGKVVLCNSKVAPILGLDPNRSPGTDFRAFVRGDWKSRFDNAVRTATYSGGKVQLLNAALMGSDTSRILNLTLSPLRDSKGQLAGAVLVGSDVTELRSMEHELQQTKQFSLLGQIAAGLAHDVKNPLMNINGCIHALLRNTTLDVEHAELLNLVLHESARVNDVVEQMLSFGNVTAARHPIPLDLNDSLANCARIINRQKNVKMIDVALDLDRSLPAIRADNGTIQQAFLNILVNSVEAIETSGSIQITSRLVENRGIEVEITDSGCGISEEDQSRLFTPYYSTKADHGSSGLGLFLAKRVFEQHKASICVTSRRGAGTKVTVLFPLPHPALEQEDRKGCAYGDAQQQE